MKHTVYKVTNLINDKIYIGAHSTENINDSYMGSGKLIIAAHKKYGIKNFKKDILFVFDTEHEMFKKEAELVTEEFVALETNYNLDLGGKGGAARSKEVRAKISENNARHNLGKTISESSKKKMSDAKIGILLSDDHKKKISKSLNGVNKSDSHRENIRLARLGTKRSEVEKENMRKGQEKVPNKLCEYCGISCKPAPYKRWHGVNCKLKKTGMVL